MITYWQAVIFGVLQGISELFPISSLGHSVILPKLVGWNVHQRDPYFLSFLVATHLATALVLFFFFWTDWFNIIKGMGRSLVHRQIRKEDYHAKLGWLLVVGTIPTGLIGLLFEEKFRMLFASAQVAAFFLIFNGILLWGAEILRRKALDNQFELDADKRIAQLSWTQAIKVGLSQVIALIPGFSRSGSTMAGSLLVGLSHEDAARFSFLLATPIIGAAAVLKIPELFEPANRSVLGQAILGAICAGVSAYLAVKFLMRYFHTNKLTPFAVYCFLLGIITTGLFLFRK